ncbi:MAG: GntR family transcriptional regulator [Sphaerochaetaceae bacterium]|nr:GntR family transcriptional regulator [Sphaerochaetaceae bacterium]MDC7237314.1 GntR family transcriptional regulator [Sphaerochaetaceae bacterium]MDC7250392.1 GntR family transcriptional regulator [Sphaerochaetaceae bacterium]
MARNLRSTASDEIFNILRKEILSLEFLPGQELKINNLCEQLQVSRSPVRDALMKLSTDGLVDIFPQRGTRVSLIDLQLVEEERFLRSSLEEKALIKAISTISDDDINKYQLAIKQQENLLSTDDLYEFFNSDVSFHKITFDLINKRECWKIINKRCVNYDRIRFLSFKNNIDKETIINQHYKIIKALKSKDKNQVETVIKTHLSKIDDEINSLFNEFPSYFKQEEKEKKLTL